MLNVASEDLLVFRLTAEELKPSYRCGTLVVYGVESPKFIAEGTGLDAPITG